MKQDSTTTDAQESQYLEQFKACRAEINLLIQLRNGREALLITSFGIIVAAASKLFGKIDLELLLYYPFVAYALAYGWSNYDVRISELRGFIRNTLEKECPGLCWQRHLAKIRLQNPNILRLVVNMFSKSFPVRHSVVGAFLLFVGSQVVAICLADRTNKILFFAS